MTPGPLGPLPRVVSTLFGRECASVTFDSRGRLLTVCVGLATVDLRLIDPAHAGHARRLPAAARGPASSASGPSPPSVAAATSTSTSGTGSWSPTSDGHIRVIAETGTADAPTLTLRRDYDVVGATSAAR